MDERGTRSSHLDIEPSLTAFEPGVELLVRLLTGELLQPPTF
jgi:hypothetical protein